MIVLSVTRPHLDKWGPPLGMPVPHVISGSLKESSADAVVLMFTIVRMMVMHMNTLIMSELASTIAVL